MALEINIACSNHHEDENSIQLKCLTKQRSTRVIPLNQREKSSVARYTFKDIEHFNDLLHIFNNTLVSRDLVHSFISEPLFRFELPVESGYIDARFEFVGFVNVSMRMCFRCKDQGKLFKMDRYYVDILEKANMRTTLCYGCMGAMLRKLTASMS